MLTLPHKIMTVILPFTVLFSETVWDYAQILLMGAVLAPGKRTVIAALPPEMDKVEKQSLTEFNGYGQEICCNKLQPATR